MDIQWYHNGHILKDNENTGITITRINKRLSTLSIEFTQAEHSGEYTCTVSNQAGTVSHSTILAINGTSFKDKVSF